MGIGRGRRSSTGRGQAQWPVFVLLVLTVVLPTAGLLWFMVHTMDNERLAVRQRLGEVDRGQLSVARDRLEARWASRVDAILKSAILTQADMNNAVLTRATLTRATLINTALKAARINGADLRGADLNGADIKGADFSGARLDGAKNVKKTKNRGKGKGLRFE